MCRRQRCCPDKDTAPAAAKVTKLTGKRFQKLKCQGRGGGTETQTQQFPFDYLRDIPEVNTVCPHNEWRGGMGGLQGLVQTRVPWVRSMGRMPAAGCPPGAVPGGRSCSHNGIAVQLALTLKFRLIEYSFFFFFLRGLQFSKVFEMAI